MPDNEASCWGIWICSIILAALLFVMMILLVRPVQAQDTNSPEIQAWFASLTNRMGGSCCGEGDAYPARVTRFPTKDSYKEDGIAEIIDTSAKDIVVNGQVIKARPMLIGHPIVTFDWYRMTKEKYGNPFDYALVFVAANADGTVGRVWCVVVIPLGY